MKNIILAGVGGQGLVLGTKIISEAAFKAGYDIKSNDVIGLSQRGGRVYGTVRIGEKVNSPNIPNGCCDILLGLEPLEAYRWSYMLNDDALVILNTYRTYPTPVLMEVAKYPENISEYFSKYNLVQLDAVKEASTLGNTKVANTFLIGALAKNLQDMIDKNIWIEVLSQSVPKKALEENLKAFDIGYNL